MRWSLARVCPIIQIYDTCQIHIGQWRTDVDLIFLPPNIKFT